MKYLRRGLLACVLAASMVPVISSANASAAAWCRGGLMIMQTRYGPYHAQQWTNCLQTSGNGSEIGVFRVTPPHSGQLPGRYHVQLTDNGYNMASTGEAINPYSPFTLYAGWVYHPYGGNYCSIVWGHDQWGYFDAVPRVCAYTAGF